MNRESIECLQIYPNVQKPNVNLIMANPLNIIIEDCHGQVRKVLELKNIYPCRIAFRIKCNDPTRYIVSPNRGFLAINEKIMINIILVDSKKYQANHAFLVQAIPAPGNGSDRKLIWKQPNVLGIETKTRIRTIRPKATTKSGSIDGLSASSGSAIDLGSSLTTTTSSTAQSDADSLPPIDHGEHTQTVVELTEQLRRAIDEKKNQAAGMVSIINEIKQIEVELDRQTQIVNELSERIKNGEIQFSNLVLAEMTLKSDLEKVRKTD